MSPDLELDAWTRQWRRQATPTFSAAELRAGVERETRRTRVGLIVPILVTVIIGGGVFWRAVRTGAALDAAFAATIWGFIVAMWVFSLWAARGTWRVQGESTAEFVELSIRRCRSVLMGLRAASVFYLAELAFVIWWRVQFTPETLVQVLISPQVMVVGWIGVPVCFACMAWFARRKRAQLEWLLEIRRQLQVS